MVLFGLNLEVADIDMPLDPYSMPDKDPLDFYTGPNGAVTEIRVYRGLRATPKF